MKIDKQQRLFNIKRNTARIEALDLPLHYFSDIHVRINDKVDFWLSTGNWHLKGKKKEGKSYAQMVNYLTGEDMEEPKRIEVETDKLVDLFTLIRQVRDQERTIIALFNAEQIIQEMLDEVDK